MTDLLWCKTQDKSEYIALWIPSLLSFSSVSCKNRFLQHFCVQRHWTPLGTGSLTFCSWSVMMFLSASPWTSGKESSTAMAISVRSCFKSERRFASLNSSILDTICLVSKHNSDLTGRLTGVLHAKGVSLKEGSLLHASYFTCHEVFFHALLQCNEFTYLCITKSFMYFLLLFLMIRRMLTPHWRAQSKFGICGVFLGLQTAVAVCWPLRRIKSHAVHLGEYLPSCCRESRAEASCYVTAAVSFWKGSFHFNFPVYNRL